MNLNLVDEFETSMEALGFQDLSNDCANLAQLVFI
jgi:hypothetical protein